LLLAETKELVRIPRPKQQKEEEEPERVMEEKKKF
jgi:hypothetical protein